MIIGMRGPVLVVTLMLLPLPVGAQEPTCFGMPATIVATGDEEHVEGTSGDDVIMGSEERDLIYSLGGDDRVCAGNGSEEHYDEDTGSTDELGDFVDGGGGNDQIDLGAEDGPGFESALGMAGDDIILDDEGTARLMGDVGNDHLNGGRDTDYINGNDGDDNILGGEGADELTGEIGRDFMYGGGGDDHLIPMQGADSIDGGEGRDLLDLFAISCAPGCYRSSPRDLYVNLAEGVARGMGRDTLMGVEDVWGGTGEDEIIGDEFDNLLGAQDPDGLGLGNERNRLVGGGGDDTLLSGVSRDAIVGGDGNDALVFAGNEFTAHIDLRRGFAETDEARDTIVSIENARGTGGRDTFKGDSADNMFFGESGNDVAFGRGGNDILHGGGGRNENDGGAGTDHCERPSPSEGAIDCES